jgi:hypothetical protein
MRSSKRLPRAGFFVAVFLSVFFAVGMILRGDGRALAYDPATTHAGLTERAALASKLNRVLTARLGKPLGLFETIVLDSRQMQTSEARYLGARLSSLDPEQGYRPGDDGGATALCWVVAGSVVAGTPAERGRNTFFDPSRKTGLHDGGGAAEVAHSLRLLMDAGGSPRGLATGTGFSFSGPPATEWLVSRDNDVGLPVFYDQLEKAVSGAEPAARSTALARALLALGGTLAVVEDAGEPAHVRNDFQQAFLQMHHGSPFDRSSAFERYVAEAYGRAGVPAPTEVIDRPNVFAFISAGDAQGLADRTQRRFFSPGSLPADAVVDRDTTTRDVVAQARDGLPYGLPGIPRLELREMGHVRYVETSDGAGEEHKRRLLAYERVPGRVRFFMDRSVYQDSARVLLPEIGGYAAGLIDHLFRGELALTVADSALSIKVTGARGALRAAKIYLFAENSQGRRWQFAAQDVGNPAEITVSTSLPADARRVAAVVRGEDDAGPFVALVDRSVR